MKNFLGNSISYLAIGLAIVASGCSGDKKPKEKELATEGVWVKESDAKAEQGPSSIVFLNVDKDGEVFVAKFPQEKESPVEDSESVATLESDRAANVYRLELKEDFRQNLEMAKKSNVKSQETHFVDFMTVIEGAEGADSELKTDDLNNIFFEQTDENKAQLVRDHASRDKHAINLVKVKASKIEKLTASELVSE